MSDEINWDIDSLRMMVVELNRKGIEVKNKVANIFWQFRYQVTPYWEGENYNNVMEFVNEFVHYDGNGGYGTGFKEKTDLVAYDIPRKIEDFVNIQAQAGGGQAYNQNLISAYDSGNSDVWEVPLSVISKDGARRISIEKVQQFFVGTADPSVRGEVELAKTKLYEYLAIFDAYEPYTKGNAAAVTARADVEEFINMFIERTNYMLGVVVDVANAEISGIENVDIESIKMAHQGITVPGNDGGDNGGGSRYDWENDPCHLKPSGTNAPDGYDWENDPCHFRNSGSGSNSGNNNGSNGGNDSGKSSDGSRYDWKNDPCHRIPSGTNAPDGYDWENDPCHFMNSGSGSNNGVKPSEGSEYDWKNDPCHRIPSGTNVPNEYDWNNDPCHFKSIGSTSSSGSSGTTSSQGQSTWSDPCHFYGPNGSSSDPCHFYSSPSSSSNNSKTSDSNSGWSDPCHFYGPNGSSSDPCHFYN